MLITRKFGKLILGKATPAQIILACILGSMLGWVPSLGMVICLTLCMVILNANLFLAIMMGLLAKVLSLLLVPITFAIGQWMLTGPLSGLFAWIINTPVLALLGFEYYLTTGSLLVSFVFGLLAGLLLVRAVKALRAGLLNLDENSEAFQKFTQKGWVKLLCFLFLGGSFKDMADRFEKKGKFVRPIGIIFAVLVIGLLVIVSMFFKDDMVRNALVKHLTDFNGATVELAKAEVDLKSGRMTLHKLSMCNPDNLKQDRFRAETLEFDIDTKDLLRKRLAVDNVQVTGAEANAERNVPGSLTRDVRPLSPQPEQTDEGEKSLEDYLSDPEFKEKVETWAQRIQDAIDRLGGSEDPEADPGAGDGSLADRIARQVAAEGYAAVRADHLIEGAPSFLVRRVAVEKMSGVMADQTVDIEATNLSTQPNLVDGAPSIKIKSSGGTFNVNLSLDDAAKAPKPNGLLSALSVGFAADAVADQLNLGGENVMSGGTVGVQIEQGKVKTVGGIAFDNVEIKVNLNNTTLEIPGAGPTPVEKLPMRLVIDGPIDRLRITFDHEKFAEDLQKAGLGAVADKYKKKLDEEVAAAKKKVDDKIQQEKDKATQKLTDKLDDKLKDKVGGGLGDLLGGDKKPAPDEDKKTTEEDEKKPDPAGDALKKGLEGLLK